MSLATKFRELADAMTKEIAEKNRPRLENTHRRANIAAGIRSDARKLEKLQAKLYALADAHANECVPELLKGVTSKIQVDYLLTYERYPAPHLWDWHLEKMAKHAQDDHERQLLARLKARLENNGVDLLAGEVTPVEALAQRAGYTRLFQDWGRLVSAGITSALAYEGARLALLALGDPRAGEVTAQDRIRQMERALIGSKIPGFFPTPAEIVVEMLNLADIQPGDAVLEPSAGKGNIADMIRERHPGIHLECVERHASLRSILQVKGHTVTSYDFLEHTGDYDVIVMNPPFELFQDIQHVRHAWSLLREGGRLVSVMGESSFFRQDKIAVEFRAWLDEQEALVIPLPEGAFKESGTGVRSRIVMLEKWGTAPAPATEEEAPPPVAPEDRYQYALPGMGAKDKRIPWRQLKLF